MVCSVIIIVFMYLGCTGFLQMHLDTYSNPSWTEEKEDLEQTLPTVIGHYYPFYPSSLSYKCSDWSIIYRLDTEILPDGSEYVNQTFAYEK